MKETLKMKKVIIGISLVIVLIIACVLFVRLTDKKAENTTEGNSDSVEMDVKKLGEEQKFYENGLICDDVALMIYSGIIEYVDLKTGDHTPFCFAPECEHNSEDCAANYMVQASPSYMQIYEKYLYVLGTNNDGNMYVYRNELDGTNKEKMAVYAGAGIGWISNCVQQDEKIYFIATELYEYNDKTLEDGSKGTNVDIASLFCYDFKNNKLEKLYSGHEGYYAQGTINYVYNDKIAFSYLYNTKPDEDLYDIKTGEYKLGDIDPNTFCIGRTYFYDIKTGEVEESWRKTSANPIGMDDKYVYFFGNKDGTGKTKDGLITILDYDMNYIKTIRLEDHPTHESYWACKISGGYIVSDDENKLLLKYNDDGKLIQKITNAEYAIGEEYGDYYILKENAFGWGFIGLTKKDKLNWENV